MDDIEQEPDAREIVLPFGLFLESSKNKPGPPRKVAAASHVPPVLCTGKAVEGKHVKDPLPFLLRQ